MRLLKNNPYKNWKETRRMGRWKFALTHGSVFGLIIWVSNLIHTFFTNKEITSVDAIIFLAISLIMGVVGYYAIMWWTQEKISQQKKRI
jgi:hypothetical protein